VVMLLASDGKGSNGGIVGLLDKAIEDRTAYAKYHGYDFMFTNTTKYDLSRFGDKIHPVWAKIPAIKDAFDTYPDAEWVWWLDQDAIIMTPQINLWDHILSPKAMKQKLLKNEMFRVSGGREIGIRTPAEINPDEINFIVANDQNGFNAGSFLIRRSEWTEWLLENWLNPIYVQKDWPGREQDAFGHMVEFNKKIRDHTGLVNQRLFNSYAHIKWDFMGFFPGDLVVHLAGCWVNRECKEIWDEMWAMR
ncbi:galactosyl transferase, partial [Saitoella complicata NRRL Y-17804]